MNARLSSTISRLIEVACEPNRRRTRWSWRSARSAVSSQRSCVRHSSRPSSCSRGGLHDGDVLVGSCLCSVMSVHVFSLQPGYCRRCGGMSEALQATVTGFVAVDLELKKAFCEDAVGPSNYGIKVPADLQCCRHEVPRQAQPAGHCLPVDPSALPVVERLDDQCVVVDEASAFRNLKQAEMVETPSAGLGDCCYAFCIARFMRSVCGKLLSPHVGDWSRSPWRVFRLDPI